MKWFKHYSGAVNSESLADLIRDTGFQGYGRYFRLLEHLAGLFDGETVSFRIPIETIRGLLRVRSWNELESFADHLSTIRGLNMKRNGNVFEIEAPILLELQDRDFKKARNVRDDSAPKNKIKNKDIDLELDKELLSVFDFEAAFELYPIQKKGPNAEARFNEQIKTQSNFDDLLKSIKNYKNHLSLPQNNWRVPKQTFAAYLGTKSSGFFWTDWVNHVEAETTAGKKSNTSSDFEANLRAQAERLKDGV